MFVRKKRNISGSTSIQIIQKVGRTNKLIQTVGSSTDEIEIEKLYVQAKKVIATLEKQQCFDFLDEEDSSILTFTKTLSNANIKAVGAELIFGALFDHIGFNPNYAIAKQ